MTELAWADLSPRFKQYFTDILHASARMSKDTNTQVGSLIIDTKQKVVVSSGWNDLPRGVRHILERNSRPLKYKYTSHAELSCLTNALRLRADVNDCTMLVTLACCCQCGCSVVNSGIGELVTPTPDLLHPTYGDEFIHTINIMQEGGVSWVYDDSLILPR